MSKKTPNQKPNRPEPLELKELLVQDYIKGEKVHGISEHDVSAIERQVLEDIRQYNAEKREAKPRPKPKKKRLEETKTYKKAERLGYRLTKNQHDYDLSSAYNSCTCKNLGPRRRCKGCRLFARVKQLMAQLPRKGRNDKIEWKYPEFVLWIQRETSDQKWRRGFYREIPEDQQHRAVMSKLADIADKSIPYLGKW